MQWFHVAQLAAFAIAAALAWKTPRAPLWAFLLAVSYVFSILYIHNAPRGGFWPPSQLVSLLIDGVVLIIVREYHRENWEWYGIRPILICMCSANLLQLGAVLLGFPPPLGSEAFGILLEFLNYLALLLIGGVGLMDLVRADARSDLDFHRLHSLHRVSVHRHSQQKQFKSLRKW